MSRAKKAALAVTVASLAAVLSVWLAVPRLAREAFVRRAAEAGWEADVGRVEVGWSSVSIRDVRLRSRNGWATAYVDEVVVQRDGFEPGDISARGVQAKLKGPRPARETKAGEKASRKVSIVGADVEWEDPFGPKSRAVARGMAAELGGASSATAEIVEASGEWGSAKAENLAVSEGIVRISVLEAEVKKLDSETRESGEGRKTGEEDGRKVRLMVNRAKVRILDENIEANGLILGIERTNEGARLEATAEKVESDAASAIEAKADMTAVRNGNEWEVTAAFEGGLSVERVSAVGTDVSLRVKAALEATASANPMKTTVKSARLETGALTVEASGYYSPWMASLDMHIHDTGCQEAFDSLPRQLVGRMEGTRMDGRVEMSVSARVDLPDRKSPEVEIKLQNGCRVREVPEEFGLGRLGGVFTRTAVMADGTTREVKSGPGTAYWVPVRSVSRHLLSAVMATEDSGFLSHKGILVEAMERAIELDVKEGRFARGASTITMQLAKNLWLGREKTVARKLQEAVLATYLEQRWSKDQILEYYVNLAEFAPGVYGVGEASQHYFKTDATQLSLSQSLVMALALPSPSKTQFGPDGELFPSKLALVRRVMGSMNKTGKLSDEELAEALTEVPVLGGPIRKGGQEIKASEDGLSPDWE